MANIQTNETEISSLFVFIREFQTSKRHIESSWCKIVCFLSFIVAISFKPRNLLSLNHATFKDAELNAYCLLCCPFVIFSEIETNALS